jgi:hypothetical protein
MSTTSNENGVIEVSVNGAELALLLSVTLLAGLWSFERQSARVRSTPELREKVRKTNDLISRQSRQILETAGMSTSQVSPWTREFIAKRETIQAEIHLVPEQLSLCVWALRICYEEFATNWDEFCTVSPGGIEWYDLSPDDLMILADNLEKRLRDANGLATPRPAV